GSADRPSGRAAKGGRIAGDVRESPEPKQTAGPKPVRTGRVHACISRVASTQPYHGVRAANSEIASTEMTRAKNPRSHGRHQCDDTTVIGIGPPRLRPPRAGRIRGGATVR